MPPYATLETMFFVDYKHFFNRKNKISAGESWRKILNFGKKKLGTLNFDRILSFFSNNRKCKKLSFYNGFLKVDHM